MFNFRKNNDLCIPPQWKGFFSMKPTPVEVSFKLHFLNFYMQVFKIPCEPPLGGGYGDVQRLPSVTIDCLNDLPFTRFWQKMHGHFAGSNCPNFLGCNTVCGGMTLMHNLCRTKKSSKACLDAFIRAILLNGPVKQAKNLQLAGKLNWWSRHPCSVFLHSSRFDQWMLSVGLACNRNIARRKKWIGMKDKFLPLGPKPLTTTVTPVLNRHPGVSQDCSFRTGVQW